MLERFHMGIALLALHGLSSPLQALAHWFSARPTRQQRRAAPRRLDATTSIAANDRCTWTSAASASNFRPARPLRVVRVVEAGQPVSGAGRMVISGRLADVCAELDRLAAQEAGRQ